MPKSGTEPRPSLEEFRSRWISLEELGQQLSWARADLAREAVLAFGKGAIKDLAQVAGQSESYIRSLVATANRFPEPEDRLAAPPISFSHFRVCAQTGNPQGWLQEAVANSWSVRELTREIQAAKDKLDEAERYRRDREALEREVARFNERWTEGEEAVLSWRDRAAEGAA